MRFTRLQFSYQLFSHDCRVETQLGSCPLPSELHKELHSPLHSQLQKADAQREAGALPYLPGVESAALWNGQFHKQRTTDEAMRFLLARFMMTEAVPRKCRQSRSLAGGQRSQACNLRA